MISLRLLFGTGVVVFQVFLTTFVGFMLFATFHAGKLQVAIFLYMAISLTSMACGKSSPLLRNDSTRTFNPIIFCKLYIVLYMRSSSIKTILVSIPFLLFNFVTFWVGYL